MSRFNISLDRAPGVFRYLLILGVVAFVSFLFPSNVRFKYEFEKGQTWGYEDLEAPFDFAIKKPEEEIRSDLERLEREFNPYYQMDLQMAEKKAGAFRSTFDRQLERVAQGTQFADVRQYPQTYLNFGLSLIDRVYNRGVIQLAEMHAAAGPDFVVNIVRGNETRSQKIGQFYRETEVRTLLSDSLPFSRLQEPEFLFPILDNLFEPNILYDDTLTNRFKTDLLAQVSTTRGMVRKGELIIPKGGVVTDEVYQKLDSLKDQYEKTVTANKSRLSIFIGYFLLTSLIIGVFILYLRSFAPEIYRKFPKLVFIFLWLVAYSYLVNVVEKADILSSYLIPFCIVPIVIKTFYEVRLALFTHIVVVLIASFLSSLGYEFTFLQILAGIVVVLTDVDTRDFSRFFYSMLYIFLTYAVGYFGLSLIQEGTLASIDWSVYTWIFLNVFLTLLAYPLVPLLERVFGFTSAITLVELSDMNRPLLQKLAIDAPGTLQHSLQVANLSEAAARKIGANHLLVKVAALYHDIGKTNNPGYFIENQGGKNLHDDLSHLESARMIISHVEDGVEMARKARLPKVLIDFIRTHHGTTRVEYFFRSFQQAHPEELVDEQLFRYPGPRPSSKEETILMMADSIEAACKSLKNPTSEEVDQLVNKIIAGKIANSQLDDSCMTFQELEVCKEVFKQVMKSVHHVRIEYPEEQNATPGK